jgi:hypothetical protein
MGYGNWNDGAYKGTKKGKDAFAHSHDTLSKPKSEWQPHQLLNPHGLHIRESRDSAEHPESNAIMIGLDVTGSMAAVVVAIRDSLGKLMDMLLNGKYVEDPQILFYAVGDATCDTIPFQVSQFESDNKINDQLTLVVLEGRGGGQMTESYELGFYCAAVHTSIDCVEKRNKKGYLVSIGDELPYSEVNKEEVTRIFGKEVDGHIPLKVIVEEAQRKYHTFHIVPRGSSHYTNPAIRNTWMEVLGGSHFVFMLEDPTMAAETIALAIGLNEGRLTLDEGIAIVAQKSGQGPAEAVRRTLQDFAAYTDTLPKNRASSIKKGKTKDTHGKPKSGSKEKKDWQV